MPKVWTNGGNSGACLEVSRFDSKTYLGGEGKGFGSVDGQTKDLPGNYAGDSIKIMNMEEQNNQEQLAGLSFLWPLTGCAESGSNGLGVSLRREMACGMGRGTRDVL